MPFLFLPGAGLLGYFLDEWVGVAWALTAWSTVVLTATLLHLKRTLNRQRRRKATQTVVPLTREPAGGVIEP